MNICYPPWIFTFSGALFTLFERSKVRDKRYLFMHEEKWNYVFQFGNWIRISVLSITLSFKLIYSLCFKYLLIANMFMKYRAGTPIVNQRGAPAIGAKVIRNSPATQLQHYISRSLSGFCCKFVFNEGERSRCGCF